MADRQATRSHVPISSLQMDHLYLFHKWNPSCGRLRSRCSVHSPAQRRSQFDWQASPCSCSLSIASASLHAHLKQPAGVECAVSPPLGLRTASTGVGNSRRLTSGDHGGVQCHHSVYGYREDTFRALQPYVGAGLGVFFAHTNGVGGTGSAYDNTVPVSTAWPAFGIFVIEHVAGFGKYKYNRATFNFDNVSASGGLRDYLVSHIVGGLSFHF